MRRFLSMVVLVMIFGDRLVSQAPAVAITNINVVDVVRGEILYNQTVVLSGGRIESVAASDKSQVRSGVQQIAGNGRYLIPGLWDMHVHLRSDQRNPVVRIADANAWMLDLFLPNGVTGIREMGGDLADEVLQWRSEIAAGKRSGPRILTAGRKIDRETPAWAGSLGVSTEAEAREAVRQVKHSGADFVKSYFNDVSPQVLRAVVDEAHKLNLRLTGHKPINMSIQEFLDSGMDGMEHSQYLPATLPEEYASFVKDRTRRLETKWAMDGAESYARLLAMEDKEQSEAVYRRMAEKKFWVAPTLAVYDHDIEAGSKDYEKDARKRYFFPAIWATWDPKTAFRPTLQGRVLDIRTASIKRWQVATVAAHKAGVPMILGTDTGANNFHVMPGWSVHEEMAALVKAGLSSADVLRMATVNAARWRGEEATEGTVERGKVADLVVLRSNPLTTIRHTQEIDAVVKGGRWFTRAELDERLERVARRVAEEHK